MDIKLLAEKLKKGNRYAIFTHIRPDGDTIGSAVALCLALRKLGKYAQIFSSDTVPEKFEILPEVKSIKNSLDGEYDVFVAVDCSDIARTGVFANDFAKHKNTFVVDHHVSNDGYGKVTYMRDTASNCENMYDLIISMGVTLDVDIATALLLGLSTDTGNFSHKGVGENPFYIASKLTAVGADINKIHYEMFKKQSKSRAKLHGIVMSKIRYFLNDELGIISIFRNDFSSTGADPSDTEGFIDFLMNVDSVKVGICIMETKDKTFKISFRSKGIDVNEIAGVFGGGGHVLASGCMLNGYYEDVVDRLVYACKQRM